MVDYRRLAEILRTHGTLAEGRSLEGERPFCQGDVWHVPLGAGQVLRVAVRDLPPLAAELLALYIEEVPATGAGAEEALVREWLAGRDVDGENMQRAVAGLWTAEGLGSRGEPPISGAVIVTVEFGRAEDVKLVGEAVALFEELLEEELAIVATDGERLQVLLGVLEVDAAGVTGGLPSVGNSAGSGASGSVAGSATAGSHAAPEEEQGMLTDKLRAWLDTVGTELLVLVRAGVSQVHGLAQLEVAREEAAFALAAGRQFRSQETLHVYGQLGLARVLYGVPEAIREAFIEEVLPAPVLDVLSPELRETIVAFVEHGQQLTDTAKSLYIHRNTLLYRLDRITELTGLEIRNPLQGWTLWLALLLRRAECTK